MPTDEELSAYRRGELSEEDAAWWRDRLHPVARSAGEMSSWVGTYMGSRYPGRLGFAIDRFQQVRGIGYLADVACRY